MNKPVNVHSKDNLARLLATESLYVTHDPTAPTASFDPKNRIVTLPILKVMDGYHYNAFVAHECGHAIYTPTKEYMAIAKETHHVIANIVEDARIEKLIQRKHPGFRKDFYNFYKDICDENSNNGDWFGLNQVRKVSQKKLTLADKLNLQFKVGTFFKVEFTPEEQHFVPMLAKLETWEETEDAIRAVFEWMKSNDQIKEIASSVSEEFVEGDDGEGEESGEQAKGKSKKGKKSKQVHDQGENAGGKEFESGSDFQELGKTLEDMDKTIEKKVVDTNISDKKVFGDVAKLDKKTIEDSIKDVRIPQKDVKCPEFDTFLSSVLPVVNMMVSNFNMYQSAKRSAKETLADTGTLNKKKLHAYQYASNIFKKSSVVYDDKNHGLVIFLDWSGSMTNNILSTYKQLLILTEFCRKIQIPFEIYCFTDSSRWSTKRIQQGIYSNNSATLFKLFDSTLHLNSYRKAIKYLFKNIQDGSYGVIASMGGTPLNNVAFLSEYVIKNFKLKFGCEKTIMCLLSDGEGHDSIELNGNSVRDKQVIMRDTYSCKNFITKNNTEAFHTIFNYVKNKCDVSKMIGFYLTDSLSDNDTLLLAPQLADDKVTSREIVKKFNENNFAECPKYSAFDRFFAISIKSFDVSNAKNLADRVKSMVFLKTFIKEIG